MPFALRNTGSTYQRMVIKMFKEQLGRNMEAYIDDMVVKSKVTEDHLTDLADSFETLWKHHLKLNASKCAFGVSSGKFLGYLVTHRGIEVNPDQIVALQNLKSPWSPKEVQRLTGMTAAFNRSVPEEMLYMDLTVIDCAVSDVLLRLDQGIQNPIFYINKTLVEAETRSDFTGRIAKWGASLGAFDLQCKPRTSIKGQVLADFIAEFTPKQSEILRIDEGKTMEPRESWGLGIVWPFPRVMGNGWWLVTGTDYFTKWVETEPFANIRDTDVKRFVWKNIVTQFSVLKVLISDSGLQLDSKAFQRNCLKLGITNRYLSPPYPQGNGQVEATNKSIVNGLKRRLDDSKGRWTEKLPSMLWVY
ncbi:uncharacterized protein LOC142639535 [Castanea sativa]|uniref:uncharacterized protein LOC142639535 n=1 Tax=Castanea sativa TaxID=21020 RepID=UPI003F64E198